MTLSARSFYNDNAKQIDSRTVSSSIKVYSFIPFIITYRLYRALITAIALLAADAVCIIKYRMSIKK